MFVIKKINPFVFLAILTFIITFAAGFYLHFDSSSSEQSLVTHATPKFRKKGSDFIQNPNSENNSSALKPDKKSSFVHFFTSLQGKPSLKTLNQAFEEVFSPQLTSKLYDIELRRWMLLNKWGKTAPLTCLEKLQDLPYDSSQFIGPVLYGWASVNPETAIAYCEEKFKNESIPHLGDVITVLATGYAEYDADKAWDWVSQNKEILDENEFQEISLNILRKIAKQKPSYIPEFLQKIGVDSVDEETSYQIGILSGLSEPESGEWINKLPKKIKNSIENGRTQALQKSRH